MAEAPATDAELVADLAAGHGAALTEIYVRHGGAAWSVARRVCGDPERAEGVVRDLFVDLWRDGHRMDPSRVPLRPWLVAAAHAAAVGRSRAGGHEVLGPRESVTAVAARVATLPPAVRRAAARLPSDERDAVFLAYLGGLTSRQVAGVLQVPERTARSRIRRGLAGFRRALESGGGGVAGPSPGDHRRDDLAVAAVDALEGVDRVELEAHMAACSACRHDLAVHRRTLAAMVGEEDPPPRLWDEVVDAIEAEVTAGDDDRGGGSGGEPVAVQGSRPVAATEGPGDDDLVAAAPPPVPATGGGPAGHGPRHLRRRPRRRRLAVLVLVLLAAVAVVVAVLVAGGAGGATGALGGSGAATGTGSPGAPPCPCRAP
ncbi:MAG TPA: sigma factor-like helix-turn-helix DNA-binding protein [Acidimicrobiales bacterium]|nr:sigma factor-like helix-turn-helix DNA-binding protein [Acidimicrobiales bacterium]